jgi:hypothetical protein
MKVFAVSFATLLVLLTGCTPSGKRGIADKRTNFEQFLPMKSNPERDGLRPVKPYFRVAVRSEILREIQHACAGGKTGSSVYDQARGAGFYVNCNPANRQLLNGYVPLSSRQEPHSR